MMLKRSRRMEMEGAEEGECKKKRRSVEDEED